MNYNIHSDSQIIGLNEIYLQYLGYKTDGFFVEVGAFDGLTTSATWGLAQAGWYGVCYEPVPESFKICKENHKNHNVIALNTCIGNFIGEIPLHVCGPLSTTDEIQFHSEYWKNDYKGAYTITCPITTLDVSLKENRAPISFDILIIDVEGSEKKILEGFDISYWQPKICIIEAHEQMHNKDLSIQTSFINNFFDKAEYIKIYSDLINNIYVKKQ